MKKLLDYARPLADEPTVLLPAVLPIARIEAHARAFGMTPRAYIEMLLRYDYYAYLHEVARQAEGDGD